MSVRFNFYHKRINSGSILLIFVDEDWDKSKKKKKDSKKEKEKGYAALNDSPDEAEEAGEAKYSCNTLHFEPVVITG